MGGCLRGLIGLVVIAILIGVGASFFRSTSSGPLSPVVADAAPSRAAGTARGDPACIDKVLQAEKAGLTYGEGLVNGVPSVMVDEAMWAGIDFATKTGLAATVECAALGHDQVFAEMHIIGNMTGKVLGVWKHGKLTVN